MHLQTIIREFYLSTKASLSRREVCLNALAKIFW